MPRFTIMRHIIGSQFRREASTTNNDVASGPVHWDWLFAPDDVYMKNAVDARNRDSANLTTWATDPLIDLADVNKPPSHRSFMKQKLDAIRLANHRYLYLDYEGDIGRDRGTVDQLVTGDYEVLQLDEGVFCAELQIVTSRYFHVRKRFTANFMLESVDVHESGSRWTLEITPHS